MIEKPILSVDWDPRTLRMVHGAATKRSVRIDQVLSVPLPTEVRRDDAESLGTFIRSALDKARIRTKRAVVDIPRELINLYTLNLPKASQSDLASMVAFQIPKELPYPVDECVVEFTMFPEEEQEETNEVLVAAVRTERLDFYVKVFEQAGLKLQRIGLRPNANQLAVNTLLKATPRERVLFVDVGPVTTEIDVLHNGRLVFSRAASVTIPDSFDAHASPKRESESAEEKGEESFTLSIAAGQSQASLDAVVRELMIEVTRSVEAYRAAEPGANLDHAVIGGSCDLEEALAEAIQKQYKISAQPYNPATCFGWDADRGAAAGAFASTLGLVLAQTEPAHGKFDFLHPKKPVTRAQRRIRRVPIVAATALVFLVAAGVFYFNYIKPQYDTRERLQEEIYEIKQTLAKHKDFERMVAAIQEYESQQIVWLDELYDMIGALPDNKKIVLKKIDMKQKTHSVKFPYRASDSNVASALVAALDAVRLDGETRPQFRASLGATSLKPGDQYSHHGSVEIKIVDRDWGDEK